MCRKTPIVSSSQVEILGTLRIQSNNLHPKLFVNKEEKTSLYKPSGKI